MIVNDLSVISGVYLLYNEKKIVYVGQSINIISRVLTHKYDKGKTFNRFEIIETDDRIKLEKELINLILPKYNRQYNPSWIESITDQ